MLLHLHAACVSQKGIPDSTCAIDLFPDLLLNEEGVNRR
jgi:hypothetical protein